MLTANTRPHFTWQLRSRALELGQRTLVMGIVNVTPDSFSDGGKFLVPQRAVEHGLALIEQGADILDIGGESTRPGKKQSLTTAEEQDRILPVIEGLLKNAHQSILSADTYHADTARVAVAAGVEIVNDVSGFTWDAEMAATCAKLGCGCVLMHMRGRPETWRSLPPLESSEVVPLVRRELKQYAEAALSAGVARERVVLDPGFGFGKNFEENYPLLASLDRLHDLGFPLLSGTSRKSFIGRTLAAQSLDGGRTLTDAPAEERLYGTLATVTASALKGVHIVRVHDVRPAVQAVTIVDAILNTG